MLKRLEEPAELTDEQWRAIVGVLGKVTGAPPGTFEDEKFRQSAIKKFKRTETEKGQVWFKRVAKRIPGTKSFRLDFAKNAITQSNYGLFVFLSLKTLPFSTKSKLIKRLKKLEHQVSVIEVVELGYRKPLLSYAGVLGKCACLLVPPALVQISTGINMFTWRLFLEFVLLHLLAYRLPILPLSFSAKKAKPNWGRAVFTIGVWPILTVTAYYWLLRVMLLEPNRSLLTSWQLALVAALISGVMFYLLVAGLSALVIMISALIESYRQRRYPVADFVDHMMLLLYDLEQPKYQDLKKFSTKRRLLTHLEPAAASVERLRFLLPTGDMVTDAWLKEKTLQIAEAVRSLKRWVLTPKPDTHTHLKTRVALFLELAISGEWDAMPCAAPEGRAYPGHWLVRAGEILQMSSVVLIALALAVLIRPSLLKLTGISDTAVAGFGLWIIVLASIAVNPEKLRALRELVELIAIPWKKG
jgi:hypothetical protein